MLCRFTCVTLFILAFVGTSPLAPALPTQRGIHSPEDAETALPELDATLREIETGSSWKALFEGEERELVMMQAWFAMARKAVHNANREIAEGEVLDPEFADTFHGAMQEYLLNLRELNPGERIGSTDCPKSSALKQLLGAVTDAVEMANGIEGFQAASAAPPQAAASASEAVTFAKRSLSEVYWLMENRTLTHVTSNLNAASRDLRAALDAVGRSLDELLDEEGNLVDRQADDGEVASDRLRAFKEAMAEARTQAEFFRKTYTPNVRRDAHRVRTEALLDRLKATGFEQVFLGVTAVNPEGSRSTSRRRSSRNR